MRASASLLALLLASCVPAGHASTHEGTAEALHHAVGELPTTHPLRKDTTLNREYVAQVRASQHIEVRALERGYVEAIHVDEGQRVRKGQPLFQIMPRIYKAEFQAAQAERESARIEYENTRKLHEGNVVSKNELALAKARLDRADAEASLAEAHLQLTTVSAPFDGLFGRLEVRLGSLVEEGELLSTLSDNRAMWVYFNVSEADYLAYRERMAEHEAFPVRLRLANGKVWEQAGSVETIEADFDPDTGNIAFRATFPNPEGLLRHGETGNVVVSTELPDALLVPQKATFDVLDRTYVFVVDEHGVVHMRAIEVAEELPHLYVVGSGLDEHDTILLEGLRKVRDGQHIATRLEDPETAVASLSDLHAE